MTAPAVAPGAEQRVTLVAGWDVPALRGGLSALVELDEAFPSWRARLDVVVRTLADDGTWTGPAAANARELLLRLSAAAAALGGGFADSRAECGRLVRSAALATDRAGAALALAPALPVPLEVGLAGAATLGAAVDRLVLGAGSTPPAVAAAREALAAADVVQAAADRAADLLLPAVPSAPADLAHLLDAADRAGVEPGLPCVRDPAAVARWWAALPAAAQLAAVGTSPAEIGSLDGVPAWARDRANREVLRQAIEDPRRDDDLRAVARVVTGVLDAEDAAGRTAQLHLLDLAGDRVVLALGDLDTASAVGVVVPGMNVTPADDLGRVVGNARALAAAAARAEPGLAVAAVAWLGYRSPGSVGSVLDLRAAVRGGAALDSALDGLSASRAVSGAPRPRTTVVGHSYGTVVLDEAADRPGRLAADAVVLLGSPGMQDDAASLEVPEVYDGASPADPISWAGWFGSDTWSSSYGSTGLPADAGTGHSSWFDPDRPTLPAMGEVVAGRRDG